MADPGGERCAVCVFFRARDKEAAERRASAGLSVAGQCRRFPEEREKEPHDWCGEFKPKLDRRK